jgi:hypothetical protein
MNSNRLIAYSVSLSLIMILIAGCAQATPSATPPPPPTWTPRVPTPVPVQGVKLYPSKRAGAAMTYDTRTNRAIMFGGASTMPCWDECDLLNETYIYEAAGDDWIMVDPPTSPGARTNAAMAYDAESDRTILYAGFMSNENFAPQDTWSYDMSANTWTKMQTEGPSNRYGHSMVYDSESDRIIVFGGWNFGDNVGTNDTWAYDYNNDAWSEVMTAVKPPGRNFPAMVYDSKADRVIMWGGDTGNVQDTSVWVFNYNTSSWEERKTTSGPTSRWLHEMSYDAKADRTILYGGYTGSSEQAPDFKLNSSETWVYDYNLNTWTMQSPSVNPGAIFEFSQTYLQAANQLLLFGGVVDYENTSDKSWLYDSNANTWTEATPENK